MQEGAIYTVPQLRAAVTGTTLWDQPSVIRLGHRFGHAHYHRHSIGSLRSPI